MVKILGFSFAVIATVLAAVFLMLSWQTRERLTRVIVDSLEMSQTRLADIEARHQRERHLQVATLAENPTLKAAVDVYQTEMSLTDPATELLRTIQYELAKLQQTLDIPLLSVADAKGVILASAGPAAGDWSIGTLASLGSRQNLVLGEAVIARTDPATERPRSYLATVAPLALGQDVVGNLILAALIDDAYAEKLADEAGTDVVVFVNRRLAGSSLPDLTREEVASVAWPASGSIVLGEDDQEYVVRRLMTVDVADIYALGSITGPVRTATTEAAWVLLAIGIGALLLAGVGSWWLAHTLAAPIDNLRASLAQMADARDLEQPLPRTGASLELDALAETFNTLRLAVSTAEAESESAYLGVIGALAAALDARDPYTAGHSERVAHLSVAIAEELALPEHEIDIIRLGALLHDIGKIGIADAVLRKPGALTDEEFAQIKQHPTLGARILKPLNFWEEHLAIVELHHEQPDGRGYPYGLKGDDTPLLARIVHVADAFDAITSARAYRPSRPTTEAMAELWRCAGTGFDLQIVQAIARVPATTLIRQPTPGMNDARNEAVAFRGALVPFRVRQAGVGQRVSAG